MTKNPLINALTAALYVTGIVSLMSLGQKLPEPTGGILIPIVMLSLFTLSAAVMVFVFFYQPIVLLSESKKELAFKLLLQTIGCFAAVTILFLIMLVYTIAS